MLSFRRECRPQSQPRVGPDEINRPGLSSTHYPARLPPPLFRQMTQSTCVTSPTASAVTPAIVIPLPVTKRLPPPNPSHVPTPNEARSVWVQLHESECAPCRRVALLAYAEVGKYAACCQGALQNQVGPCLLYLRSGSGTSRGAHRGPEGKGGPATEKITDIVIRALAIPT